MRLSAEALVNTLMNPVILRRRGFRSVWAVASMWVALALSGWAGVYMKIEGVDGEVADGPFAKWSQVVGVGSKTERPVATTDPPPPPTFEFVVRKRVDKSSPVLLTRCAEGVAVGRVALIYEEGGKVMYRVVLEDVLISSFRQGVPESGEAGLVEEVSMKFVRATWSSILIGDGEEVIGGQSASFDAVLGTGGQSERPPFRAVVAPSDDPKLLRLRCPVEKGHRYRVSMTQDLKGGWATLMEFTAETDGVVEQALRQLPPVAFVRVEELD